jgi:predicted nucleic acid-binding Zn ribbon protein
MFLAYLLLSLLAGRPLFTKPGDTGARRGGGPRKKWRLWGRSRGAAGGPALKTCPVCGGVLEKGQLVKSVVFQGGAKSGNITERMTHILGCPLCYPANAKNPRICPVCAQALPADGYLIARMFEKPGRERKHVHVLGCTACRIGKKGR